MFIQEVITKIREPYTFQFNEALKKAGQLETGELFQLVLTDIQDMVKHKPLMPFENVDFKVTTFSTTGCPHWMEKGKFAGCTMCNHMSDYIDGLANLHVLKKRDTTLYAKALRYSFELQRGEGPEPVHYETVTGYDTLNPEEIPDDVFNELYGKDNLFKIQPHHYEFETRATSVNQKSIEKIKSVLGNRVSLELGVEVRDEWIRNHWLNKNITNRQIETAIELLKKEGMGISINLLIGIPGLTHEQSKKLFYESVEWLERLEVNNIICAPVAKLERTLQAVIHDWLQENEKLVKLGIVNGKQTAIFWVFTVVESLYHIYREKPSLIGKLNLSSINFFQYLLTYFSDWKEAAVSKKILHITGILKEFYICNDLEILQRAIDYLKKDKNYLAYKEFLESRKGLKGISHTIAIVAEEIARELWPEKWQAKIEGFKKELNTYNGT